MSITTRFAPSPTGFLHLGHARAALIAWQTARRASGRFLLRIEDIDPTRCRPEFTSAIFEDLAWLGLDWDLPVRHQSGHLPEYRQVLDKLLARGLIYPCFCTRAEIRREIQSSGTAPHALGSSAVYPGTCRALPADSRAALLAAPLADNTPHAWRLDMERAIALVPPVHFREHGHEILCRPEEFGDIVLARSDAPASYHLCVTHDDAVQGVTLVTRGEDLLPATAIHRLLQALMGFFAPDYEHHPLLLDATGRRLAKRDGAITLRSMRAAGLSAHDVREAAGIP